ncbi:MAG: aromatic ring-opening dioxygenase LigA [Acidobacteria bacterium]|nr:aromatic ring-opening dioxygenase LigA [Acidobacteriota bacterium]
MVKTTGIISIVAGIVLVVAGVVTWFVVSSTLADQNITTTSDACLPDRVVKGPFTAFCQADIIEQHTLDITGGKTYAELDRDDPLRETAMTSSFLRASLFTSVVAFGVAAMAIGMGVLFLFIGVALKKLDPDEVGT